MTDHTPGPGSQTTGAWSGTSLDIAAIQALLESRDREQTAVTAADKAHERWKAQILRSLQQLEGRYDLFRRLVDQQLEVRQSRPGRLWNWLFKVSSVPATLALDLPQDLQMPVSEEEQELWERLRKNQEDADDIAFARAKYWLGGITALLGVVTTAAVLAAPAAKDLSDTQRIWVTVASAASFLLLAAGVLFAYRAAYGTPGGRDIVAEGLRQGLRNDVVARKAQNAEKSGHRLRLAVVLSVLGVAATFAATAMTWYPPAPGGASSICVLVDGEVVVKAAGGSLPIAEVAGTRAEVRSC